MDGKGKAIPPDWIAQNDCVILSHVPYMLLEFRPDVLPLLGLCYIEDPFIIRRVMVTRVNLEQIRT